MQVRSSVIRAERDQVTAIELGSFWSSLAQIFCAERDPNRRAIREHDFDRISRHSNRDDIDRDPRAQLVAIRRITSPKRTVTDVNRGPGVRVDHRAVERELDVVHHERHRTELLSDDLLERLLAEQRIFNLLAHSFLARSAIERYHQARSTRHENALVPVAHRKQAA